GVMGYQAVPQQGYPNQGSPQQGGYPPQQGGYPPQQGVPPSGGKNDNTCLLIFLIICLPPVAVYIKDNKQCTNHVWICCALGLILCCWIYAIWFCFCRK
ncbi:hypothetical protein PENTCL1PPCAC_10821, partial [Pristionchus entomophagus]